MITPGKGCDFYHPKLCRPFIKFGPHGKRGCKKGSSCSYFHPKLCYKSLKPISQRICTNQSCGFFHLPRTKRHIIQPSRERHVTKRQRDIDLSGTGRQPANNSSFPPTMESDPFLGNMIRNLVKESIEIELASIRNLAPSHLRAQPPPFLPGLSHFSEPWKQTVPPVQSSQQQPSSMSQLPGYSQWSH